MTNNIVSIIEGLDSLNTYHIHAVKINRDDRGEYVDFDIKASSEEEAKKSPQYQKLLKARNVRDLQIWKKD